MISLEDDMARSMQRALVFGAFLDALTQPTPSQIWLEDAAEQLRQRRDPDGEKRHSRNVLVKKLLDRDGHHCWYCAKPLGGDITLEHLQPLALSGTWAEANLALAHRGCNKSAGHLSRIKKEHLRDEMRAKSA
jgi:5-methylcytosine-specific restriction endonuclease McrA